MEAKTLNTMGDSLKKQVQEFVLIEPSEENEFQVVPATQMAAFKATKTELVAAVKALKITTPDDFAMAGDMVTGCDAIIAAIKNRFEAPTARKNKEHKALTKAWGEADKEFVEAVAFLKGARAGWKAADDARKASEAAAEQARLRAEAEARKRAEAEAARIEAERLAAVAAEEKRLADEAAAELARVEREAAEAAAAAAAAEQAAAAEIEDPDAAMEAAAAAEEAAEEARKVAAKAEADRIERETMAAEREAERLHQAEAARLAAERLAAAPVVVPRVAAEAPVAEAGVTWADNWQAEYDPVEALKACVAAGALEYLSLNEKAINSAAKSQKSLARIPGVRVVNNKIERRSRS